MDFVVTITDAEELAGITWAREAHNKALPPGLPPTEEGGEPVPPAELPIETDAAYVQWVMVQAAKSYAQDKHNVEWRTAAEADAAKRKI